MKLLESEPSKKNHSFLTFFIVEPPRDQQDDQQPLKTNLEHPNVCYISFDTCVFQSSSFGIFVCSTGYSVSEATKFVTGNKFHCSFHQTKRVYSFTMLTRSTCYPSELLQDLTINVTFSRPRTVQLVPHDFEKYFIMPITKVYL